MFKAIIFDLDGTLLDTVETIAYYGNKALKKFGFCDIESEKYKYLAGNGAKNLVKGMLETVQEYDEEIFEKVFEYYSKEYNKDTLYKTEVYDGINELLSNAKKAGMKLAVLSNKPHDATVDVLGKFFDDNTFDFKFGAREGVPLKPDPTAAVMLAEMLGVKEKECLYVGDTDVDMKTGKNAGFYTIGVLWGFRDRKELEENGADTIASHPSEILKLW